MSDEKKKAVYGYLLVPDLEILRTNPEIFFNPDGTARSFPLPEPGAMTVFPGKLSIVTYDDDGNIVDVA